MTISRRIVIASVIFSNSLIAMAADEASTLENKIRDKAPILLTCSIPAFLKEKIKNERPNEYGALLGVVSNAAITDGCAIEIYKSDESKDYYFIVKGGLSGGVHYVLGPIPNNF